MNCHNNNNESNKKGMLKYGSMMMLCCILPIILTALFPILGFRALGFYGVSSLICPIMMIGMMFMMRKNHKGCEDNNASKCCAKNDDNDQITVSKDEYEIIDIKK